MIYESLTHYLTGIMEKLFLHTVILLNTRLSVLLHLGPPNYGAFLRTYSQLSQVRFLHTWGKRNSTCDTDVRQAGACFERSGSCSSERVKQKKRSMKSDKESDHRFCCRKHLVYILLLSYLFNDIQNVHKNITSAAFLEKQSL